MPRYLGVIPARGGSKRLPGKNLILLGGKPLLSYTFEAVRTARRLAHAVVSTDVEPIADYARSQGVDPQGLRPAAIAGDRSPVTEALSDALAKFERHQARVDAVVLLQPTSPFRAARHIDEAISLFESTGADTVTSVRASKEHPFWTWGKVGDRLSPYYSMAEINLDRSALPPAFVENGAVYVMRRSLLEGGTIYGETVVGYPMDEIASIDIDTLSDLQWAEFILSRRQTA